MGQEQDFSRMLFPDHARLLQSRCFFRSGGNAGEPAESESPACCAWQTKKQAAKRLGHEGNAMQQAGSCKQFGQYKRRQQSREYILPPYLQARQGSAERLARRLNDTDDDRQGNAP